MWYYKVFSDGLTYIFNGRRGHTLTSLTLQGFVLASSTLPYDYNLSCLVVHWTIALFLHPQLINKETKYFKHYIFIVYFHIFKAFSY